jgi:hypothetical protein
LPEWLNARARELWRPLLALAAAADAEVEGFDLTTDLLALAREHVEDRDDLSAEGDALLVELGVRLREAESITVRPGDLAEPLRCSASGWHEAPSARAVGEWLKRLGFRRDGKDRNGASTQSRPSSSARQQFAMPQTTVTPSPSQSN